MAFDVTHKYPIDSSQKGVGIDIPFNNNNVFRSTYKTSEALKNNIINYFLTNPGERYGNPKFGGGLRRFLFEQMTSGNIEFLREDIQNKFNENFPGVDVGNIDILIQDQNENQLTIKIKYSIPNTDIEDNIELNFN